MTAKDWRQPVTGDDVFGDIRKRLTSAERRPQVQKPADLLGPGIAPYAVRLADWNSQTARFNGMWWAEDAANGPTATGIYLGLTVVAAEGHGAQVAISHSNDSVWLRQVHGHLAGSPSFTAWQQIAGRMTGQMVQWPLNATLPAGWLKADGATYTTATYPELAAVLGATGTTFSTPSVTSTTSVRTIIRT